MAEDFDWQRLEDKALEMFDKVSARVHHHSGATVSAQSAQAAAELLKAMAAMRAQRLAEEKAKKEESIYPKTISSAPRQS